MPIRRRYSINVHGDLTVIDRPGQAGESNLSAEYESAVPARPAGSFARVEASLTIGDDGILTFTRPQTWKVLLSVRELLDQAAADYLAMGPRRLP
jgi:hypothetical protein